jgi:hypothetical protein
MQVDLWKYFRGTVACGLALVFAVPQSLVAQSHIITPYDLRSEAVAASQSRARNVATVKEFLSSEQAQKALKSAHMDSEQVKTAVSSLTDQELAQLAARSEKAKADFAAGTLSDRDLIIILVAIAALILIIVAVR